MGERSLAAKLHDELLACQIAMRQPFGVDRPALAARMREIGAQLALLSTPQAQEKGEVGRG